MLCSILFSIVNKEIGKKVHFCHNKDNFCSSFFILTTSFAKNGYFSENKNLFIAISLVKLNHSHRKYSRKKFYRRIFLKCRLHPNSTTTRDKTVTFCDFDRKIYTTSSIWIFCQIGYLVIVNISTMNRS